MTIKMPEYTEYECREKLKELIDGRSIIIPCDYDHAKAMLKVAQVYIKDYQDRITDIIKHADENLDKTTSWI